MRATIVNWTEEHRLGIAAFDKQHKQLNDMLNGFYKDVKNQVHQDRILKGLNALIECTLRHFESEEKIMISYNFPGYELHKMQHDAFLKEVGEFEDLYRNGQLLLTLEIVNYIKVWVEIHIDKTDILYADFLIAKGVK